MHDHSREGGVGLGLGRAAAAAMLFLSAQAVAAAQSGVTEEEVHFPSRGARLVGTLHLPEGPGPHPLIVGAHGSGRIDRSDLYLTEAAEYFAPRGVAFLAFDKRGSGESTGRYRGSYGSAMVTYAFDVLAAADYAASRADIDSDEIGLWGVSQAGWVIPIAASLDQDLISFTIIVSGPTVSIVEENAYDDLTGNAQGRPTGASPEEIARGLAAIEPKGLDASAFIPELTIPGLWIYGALDQSVPWRQGVEDLEAIVEEWDRPFTWKVFEGANHGLRRARTGGSWERPVTTRPVDGYFESMAEWLRNVVGIPVGR